jgi:integrase
MYTGDAVVGKLNTAKLRTLTKPGAYGDGGGLYLQVRGRDRRSWVFRFKLRGKAHLMGLGPLPDVGLAEARDAAITARKLVRAGVNPIEKRRQERGMADGGLSFSAVAERFTAAHSLGWRNLRHRQQWSNTLRDYVLPELGKLPVALIEIGHVMRVVEPIWHTIPETASRVRGRIEAILDYATARGWRKGDNPARWRGHLANLLPARTKLARVKHHAAVPWREIGSVMQRLEKQNGMAALALRFVVLTAARSGEVRGAKWPEIDLQHAVWTIPADRMKAGREHRVPLSEAALAMLHEVLPLRRADTDFVFPGGRKGSAQSDVALGKALAAANGNATVHGMRSTFRDWVAEVTAYPAEVAEAALAHVNRDKVEAAYQRGDLFEKRRRLMADWAAHCGRALPVAGEVVALRREVS